MAINVRYGPVGDLGALAVQAGRGQDFYRRFAAGQSLVASTRDYYARQDAQRLQAQSLQQAAATQRNRIARTPTSRISRGGPLSKSISGVSTDQFSNLNLSPTQQQALNLAMQIGDKETFQRIINGALASPTRTSGGSGGISGDGTMFGTSEEGTVGFTQYVDTEGKEQVRPFTPEEMQQRGGFISSEAPAPQLDPLAQSKREMIMNSAMTDQQKATVMPMVDDASTTLNQVAIAVGRAVSERSAEARGASSEARQDRRAMLDLLSATNKQLDNLQESYKQRPDLWKKIVGATAYDQLDPPEQQAKARYQELRQRLTALNREAGAMSRMILDTEIGAATDKSTDDMSFNEILQGLKEAEAHGPRGGER